MKLHYGMRISGDSFMPPVYEEGVYTIRVVGDAPAGSERIVRGLKPGSKRGETILITF